MFLFCYFSGQICFCLVNLEPIPYAVELKKVSKREMLAVITEMITKVLQDILCNTLGYFAYPIRNHQDSALEQAQDIFSAKIFYKRILYNKIFNQLNYHPVFCFKNLKILIFNIFFHIF